MRDSIVTLINFEDKTFFPLFFGLLYVLFKAAFYHNSPTFKGSGEPKPSRSQNHLYRLQTAAYYAPLVPCLAVFQPLMFIVFITAMAFLALKEYVQIVCPYRPPPKRPEPFDDYEHRWGDFVLITVGTFHVLSPLVAENHVAFTLFWITVSFYFLIIWHMASLFRRAKKIDVNDFQALGLHMVGFVWIAVSLSTGSVLMVSSYPFKGGIIAMHLCSSWAADAGGFYIGRLFGSHLAVPNISPKKTWEGFFASIVLCLFMSLGWRALMLSGLTFLNVPVDVSIYHYVFFSGVVAIAGLVGDLAESFVKRIGGADDSGTFFRGHGGILDRFDSFLFCTPVIFAYVTFILR